MVCCDSGDLMNARDYAEKAVEMYQTQNLRIMESRSRIWLGRILGKKDKSQANKAEESILQGIKVLDEIKYKPELSLGLLFLGELYASINQKEKAVENLKKADESFREMGMDYWIAKTHVVYADLNKQEGEESKAKGNLIKAIDIMKELEAYGWVERYEKELAELN